MNSRLTNTTATLNLISDVSNFESKDELLWLIRIRSHLEQGADVTYNNKECLHLAMKKNHLELVKTLFENGNYNPLHCAGESFVFTTIQNGNFKLMEYFVERCRMKLSDCYLQTLARNANVFALEYLFTHGHDCSEIVVIAIEENLEHLYNALSTGREMEFAKSCLEYAQRYAFFERRKDKWIPFFKIVYAKVGVSDKKELMRGLIKINPKLAEELLQLLNY